MRTKQLQSDQNESAGEEGLALGIAIGLCLSAILFALTGQPLFLVLGLSIGLAVGVLFSYSFASDRQEPERPIERLLAKRRARSLRRDKLAKMDARRI